ncbi:tetratricopeptide repeat protein [Roseimaritima ulvae]|uniref:tetratricopeptide repeat protein n=1 Tax=Roseimaritima ulvae TaxID=980254 RepID=UPI0011CDC07A|nr:tetratricopeptide repeat protein [Roseimaritima ulvae]
MSRRPNAESRSKPNTTGKPNATGTPLADGKTPSRRWARRWAIAALGLLLLLSAIWATGVLAPLAWAQADYQLLQRNHSDALYWGRVATRLQGDPAQLDLMQARIERRHGDAEAMERHLVTALAKGLSNQQAERERALAQAQSGDLQPVADLLGQWMQDPGNSAADIADAYSLGLRAEGRLAEAKVLISVWASDCPDDPKAFVEQGRIAEAEFRKPDAEQQFHRAVEVNPRYPVALYALGQWLLEQKRPQEALEQLERCSRLDPQCRPAADILRAKCQRLLGNPESAAALLADSLRASNRELEQAYLRLCTRPQHGMAEYEMGMVEFDAQRYQQAADYFQRAVNQNPQTDDAEYQLGLTLKRLGQDERSQEILTRVTKHRTELAKLAAIASRIASHPNDFEARFRMGCILMDNGRPQSGLFHLNCVLAMEPEHLPTHRRLADYYAAHQQQHPQYAALATEHQRWLESAGDAKP